MRRKVTFMRVEIEKTKQPLPENGHIFATMPLRRIVPNPCNWSSGSTPAQSSCAANAHGQERRRQTSERIQSNL